MEQKKSDYPEKEFYYLDAKMLLHERFLRWCERKILIMKWDLEKLWVSNKPLLFMTILGSITFVYWTLCWIKNLLLRMMA